MAMLQAMVGKYGLIVNDVQEDVLVSGMIGLWHPITRYQ